MISHFLLLDGPSAEDRIGSVVITVVYGSTTGGLFSLLRMVLQSVRTIFTWAVARAGFVVATPSGQPVTSKSSKLLYQAVESFTHDGDDDDDNDNVLTPMAILAIVRTWDVGTYNPPGTNCKSWLGKVYKECERFEIPAAQRAPCAMHHLRADCREAANTSGCYEMTWEKFTMWLHQYDRKLYVLVLTGVPC